MRRTTLLASLVVLGLTACPAGPSGPDGGSAGGGDGSSGGGAGTSPDGGVLPAGAIELTSLEVKVTGLRGQDVSFTVKGADVQRDAVLLEVQLLDGTGGALAAFDTNEDGALDATSGPVALQDLKWTGNTFSATAVMRNTAADLPIIDRATVKLVDALDNRSGAMTVHVGRQTVQPMGATCDPAYVVARCTQGLSCRGSPPTCQAGAAPSITRLAFQKTASGPQILIEGTEPEDDLSTIEFGFQNAQGQAISIDGDGDGTPDLASFDFGASGASENGTFFIRMQPSDGLDQLVPKLTATPRDDEGHQGPMKVAAPLAPTARGTGQGCDPRGFDVCAASLACSPGLVGKSNVCQSAATLRTSHCAAAPVLVPTAEGVTARGYAAGVSLWDAPTGCQTGDPARRPEGLVVLRLTSQASKLTLSTEHAGTTFDTALYLLPGCPENSLASLGCNDDAAPGHSASHLEVQDVPPGDYLVVVDAFGYEGGLFELTATVE